MGIGSIRQRNINEEMRESYLDYAMSVIVSRALPDARDGLKPVHRRILYAMYRMGSGPDTPYRKSARVVGEVLGKYHPHGDSSVYDSMVRMAQPFAMRYTLVDGQGNFGSIDGDAAAAMRYTEARMSTIGNHLLDDIGKDTVDYTDNFDGSLQEPDVLPANMPNLLVNGASGIAVGMSTSIPPHNLNEVCDALIYMLDNWQNLDDISVTDLMGFIQGPDFPTGGYVYRKYDADGDDMLRSAYATGRGKVIVRAKIHLEELGRGRKQLVVTEIPYQINKSSLIERIADLVKKGKVEGIVDLRDESDRQGLRIIMEIDKEANPSEVLEALFKYSPLQSTFSIIMLALAYGEPRLLSLKQALKIYVEHRMEVIRRRSQYDLAKAEQRAHIIEGLLTALNDIDKAIKIIRNAADVQTARDELVSKLKLSEVQAQAILDMQLRRLAALERQKLEEEYEGLVKLISDLRMLLSSAALVRLEVKRELKKMLENYPDTRQTEVVDGAPEEVNLEYLTLPQEQTFVCLTGTGLISRTPEDTEPRLSKRDKEPPFFVSEGTTLDTVYLFTNRGEVGSISVGQLPETEDPTEGLEINRLCGLPQDAPVIGMLCLPDNMDDSYILFTTELGQVKRIQIENLPPLQSESFFVFNVDDNDAIVRLDVVNDDDEIVIVSHEAQAIRFAVEEVRPMGLNAGGIIGIKLKGEDYVVGAGIVAEGRQVLVITDDGRGKRTDLEDYPVQGRAGRGVRTLKKAKGNENQIAGAGVYELDEQALVYTKKGRVIPIEVERAPETKRDYKGEIFFAMNVGDAAVGLGKVELILRPADYKEPEGQT